MAYMRLGDLLIAAGAITQEQLEEALTIQKQKKERLGDVLIESNIITERQLIEALQMQLGVDFIDLTAISIPLELAKFVPRAIAKKYNVVPVKLVKDELFVAMSDPLNFVAQEEIKAASHKRVVPMISTRRATEQAIGTLYGSEGTARAIEEMKREVGKDTRSYADGLRSILREDPDVILIGEMRDLNTIETALTAAETGHLVFATLHTNSAADSVDRMVNVFPEGQQHQIRLQLSTTLRAVLSQQLLPKRAGGRAAACEVMMVNSAIKNLIREGKTPQIDSFITMNAQDGSITMDNALLKMVRGGTVTYETALGYARDREAFSKGRRG